MKKFLAQISQLVGTPKVRELYVDTASLLFIVLFIYASVSKLLDYQKFMIQLRQSPLLSAWSVLFSWFVPAIEIILAIMLVFSRTRIMALYGSFTLMVTFTAYIITILNFSDYIPCSCGGILENMSWKEHLLFNLGFTALVVIGILLESEKKRFELY
ncbi:MauE/DoxX family redox-associated membrane protein [Dyadobacter frigoris]|uniref:DoxX family membrane protein n=1 Tax=Dyadobacter frigoris TaxID=2576211 RepID=A0A4U6CPZ3_9BACT|nr:MauE/DoxX family redox-associated membrane protein [Dyadobacter frigoris]TKT85491.1 DoxX family membrane protein [Dyadobacter frigoris]GLU56232.1 hypothetical protein Dfri01_56930 [Dyadobacter frigoris]